MNESPSESPSASPNWLKTLHVSDVRGVAELAVRTTRDVTGVTEGVHQSIRATLGLPGGAGPGQTAGVTGLVYRSIDGITRLTGAGLDLALGLTEALVSGLGHRPESSRARDVTLGIVNGVLGDRLELAGNPLALPMTFHHQGRRLDPPTVAGLSGVNGKLLVLMHGLCMTEHGWQPRSPEQGVDLGARLAAQFGFTPIYLRYNSGRAIADNGQTLAEQLETVVAAWPVPVEDITLLGHSMGGLLARSALHAAEQREHGWRRRLRRLVFLGTPHQGAPLERAGAWVDALLLATPYSRPFATLSHGRSQGIRDLRHGWPALMRAGNHAAQPSALDSERSGSTGNSILPPGVQALAIAGTQSSVERLRQSGSSASERAGDGLVPVSSALGRHTVRGLDIGLPESARVTLAGVDHMGLLNDPAVARAVSRWLSRVT